MPPSTLHPPGAIDPDGPVSSSYIHLRVGSRSFVGSWGSDSNDTASNLPGPGRALGQLLSAAGRRLEAAVDRTAARAGLGFEGITRRLLMKLYEPHTRCRVWPEFTKTPVVDLAIELGSGICSGCNQSYISTSTPIADLEIEKLFLRLVPSIE
jgi:hypothetical protein